MISAVENRHKADLGEQDPRKADLLRFMRSREPSAIAEGFVEDYATGRYVMGKVECAYEVGDLWWNNSDIYNLDHHDVRINPEFRSRALAIIDGENPSMDAARE